ncbi:FG-GAP-like repeat-containing protein [Aureimonas frigidaquae]|uniref:FG-GAP repeat domain protein n=1 Tax=Aureimonas frigidaquae TaxID=424757 RepID=A0A0P0Z386_9HYPH|nr:FG-GAP-like repeat-containing protein [Aureimonas frigidaquae]BAT28422.1 FG-GAP repeat domain protein [Aureimonas frigidaquae]
MPAQPLNAKAAAAGNLPNYVLSDGRSMRPLPLDVQAQPGGRYKILQRSGNAVKPVTKLIAIADGADGKADLRLLLDDGTQVTIRDFYRVEDARLSAPRADGGEASIDRFTRSLAVGGDSRDIVLLSGSPADVTALAKLYAGQFEVLSPTTLSNAMIWSEEPAVSAATPGSASFLSKLSLGPIDATSGLGLLAGIGAVGAGVGLVSSSSSKSSSSTGAKPVLSVASIAKDNKVNASEAQSPVVISGTTSHVEDGQVVTVNWGGVVKTGVVTSGTWSVSVAPGEVPADGDHAIKVSVTNLEGLSTEVAGNLPVDRIGPAIALNTTVLNKAAVTNGGTLTGTSDLPDGSVLSVTVGTVSKTATVASGKWSVAFTASDIPASATSLSVTVQGADSFGNSNLIFASPIIDKTASLSISTPSVDGRINGWDRKSSVTFQGTATGIEEGQTVNVSLNGVSHTVTITKGGTVSAPVYEWSATFTASELPAADGIYTLAAVAADKAGNTATQTLSIPVAKIFAPDAANATPGLVLNGDKTGDTAGTIVGWAGDVNGDGYDDVIVSAPDADPASQSSAGRTYIVFGGTASTAIDLSALANAGGAPKGFAIDGRATGDGLGYAVAALGDINGDGRSDMIVTAPFSDMDGPDSGRAYIIFGKTAGDTLALSSLTPSQGFAIAGLSSGDKLGSSAAAIGDVNGDGYADFLLGAPGANGGNGKAYVVFGASSMTSVQLSAVAAGNGGFAIDGFSGVAGFGSHAAGIGDINGDGLADMVISGGSTANTAYVIFGRTSSSSIAVSTLTGGSGGFAITGDTGQMIGLSLSAAGDVNGDGFADFAVGTNGTGSAGRSYVIFGSSNQASINLSSLSGNRGFAIAGATANEHAGTSIAYAGDVNGDGLADLIVGAPASDVTGTNAGRAYVVFGRTGSTTVELSALAASDGFAISGAASETDTGLGVSYAGDVNGDGIDDLIVGVPRSTVDTTKAAGQAFVIFGSTNSTFVQTAFDLVGTSANDPLQDNGVAMSIAAGTGDDLLTLTGASTAYGGAGKDVFKISGAALTSLTAPLGGAANRVGLHGGSGIDTLMIMDSGVQLDLTSLGLTNNGVPSLSGRLSSIEHIDIAGPVGANNTLKLNLASVVGITEDRILANQPSLHTLFVTGDAGDALTLTDKASWTNTGTYSDPALSVTYQILQHASGAASIYYATGITLT